MSTNHDNSSPLNTLLAKLTQFLGRGTRTGASPRRRRAQLSMECLEGRTLPSATVGLDTDRDDDVTTEVVSTAETPAGDEEQEEPGSYSCTAGNPAEDEADENTVTESEDDQGEAAEDDAATPCQRANQPRPPLPKPPLPPPDVLKHFLGKLYRELLQRDPDEAGLECWKKHLHNGVPRQEVAQQIADSEEGREVRIQGLYREHLGRDAEEGGLKAFGKAMGHGMTVDQVKVRILGSEEYFKRRGGGSQEGFIKAIYQDALGRTVDPAGAAAWAEQLAAGEAADSVAAKILGSEECKKLKVEKFYHHLLRRPADTGGLHGFTQQLHQGTREEQVICQVLGSQEYLEQK